MSAPAYGYLCLSCGQLWGASESVGKHTDPATGAKCRDVSGSAAAPSKMGPVAERVWGPEGVYAELRYDATYDHGWMPPPPEAVEQHMAEGRALIAAALGRC